MPDPAVPSGDPPAEEPTPKALVLVPVLVFTLLLSVWAAFLVPVRVGGVPAPVWILPLAAMLAMARAAGRSIGLAGALAPALLWIAITWLVLGTTRSEGDLVVPATASGYAYLFGGVVLWLAVVVMATPPHVRGR